MKAIIKEIPMKIFFVLILISVLGGQCQRIPEIKPGLDNPHKNYSYWYKGQIHCHTVNSDGQRSAYRVEQEYREKGYIFICITDHNQATNDPEVLGISHITSGEDGNACRHHVLALGINFEKVKWYHDNVNSGRDSDQDGLDDRKTCPCNNVQPRIDYITQIQETIAVLAHPTSGHNSSALHTSCDEGWSLDDLKNSSNYTGIEIYNAGGSWSTDWWDEVLSMGKHKRMWGFAGDDCHDVTENKKSFNRAWIVVNSNKGPARNYLEGPGLENEGELRQDIIQNIKNGNFYSVVRSPEITGESPSDGTSDIGPKLEIRVLGGIVSVATDQICRKITFYGGPSKILHTVRNVSGAYYELKGSEDYVRVEVKQKRPVPDGELYTAYSQPLFIVK